MNDQQVNIKLVGEVEKHSVLYNFRLPGYSNKNDTEKAWSLVAKEVHMSAAECKDRWKNLRAVFTRNIKPPKSGAGTKAKKAYYLLEAMQFTVPYIKALGAPSGNLPNSQQEEEGEQFEEIDFENNVILKSETFSPSQQPTLSPSSMSPPPAQTTEMSQKQEAQSSSKTHNKRALKNDAVDKAFMEYFHAKKIKCHSSHYANQETKTEGLKMFLLSMLPDLLNMSDEQVRQFKRKALDAVDEILSTRSMIYSQLPFSYGCSTPSCSSCSEIPVTSQAAHGTDMTGETPLTAFEVRDVTTGTGSETVIRGAERYHESVHETTNDVYQQKYNI